MQMKSREAMQYRSMPEGYHHQFLGCVPLFGPRTVGLCPYTENNITPPRPPPPPEAEEALPSPFAAHCGNLHKWLPTMAERPARKKQQTRGIEMKNLNTFLALAHTHTGGSAGLGFSQDQDIVWPNKKEAKGEE